MNVSCPTRNRIRDRARPIYLGLAMVFVVSCLTCQAAEWASWYGEEHRGLPMANGQRFNPDRFTAASWSFELGTKVVHSPSS